MGYLRLAAFAGIGVVLALAILPKTRWVLRNDLSAAAGGSMTERFYGCLDPAAWPAKTRDEHLARAVQLENVIWNPRSAQERLRALEEFCTAHPDDPVGWAFLLRLATKMPLRFPDAPRRPTSNRDAAARERNEVLMAKAIANGERLEPNNIFFTVMRASLLESQGKHREAQEAVRQASRKRDYEDYAGEEGRIVFATATNSCGYRGNALEMTVYASILLPHISPMIHLLPYVQRDGEGKADPGVQMAALRTAHTIAKESKWAVLVLGFKAGFHRILLNQPRRSNAKPQELQLAATDLDRKLGSGEATRLLKDFENVKMDVDQSATSDEMEVFFNRAAEPPLIRLTLLVCLLLAVPTVYLASGISRVKLSIWKRTKDREMPWLWTAWALALCIAVAGLVAATLIAPGSHWGTMFGMRGTENLPLLNKDAVSLGSGLLLGLSILFIPRKGVRKGLVIGIVYAVIPLFYLAFVLNELSIDRSLAASLAEFHHEVDKVRGTW